MATAMGQGTEEKQNKLRQGSKHGNYNTMRQNSENMSSPTNPVSTRTEGVSASSGQPLQLNTSKNSMLYSQVRS